MTYQEQDIGLSPIGRSHVLSVSGVPLEGDRLVHVAYMDESGVSPREPLLVQAAIIIDGNSQVMPLHEALEGLIQKHIPQKYRNGFVFHAADIFSGAKSTIYKDRFEWPDERRFAILDDLVAIPAQIGLPICVGIINKTEYRTESAVAVKSELEMNVLIHAMAIIQCEMSIENWMRKNAPDEFIHVIAENNDDVRKAAKQAHIFLKDGVQLSKEGHQNSGILPFVKIWDGLQFATKDESRSLQVADACAWACRRAYRLIDGAARFYEPLRSAIYLLDANDLEVSGSQLC